MGQVVWTDRFKLKDGRIGVVIVSLYSSGTWKVKKLALRKNKEVFDVELWGIHLAL